MKKQFRLLALLSALAPAFASAQSADNFSTVWLQGSGVVFTSDFSVSPPTNAYWDTLNLRFGHNNSNLCDSFGTLLFAANASNVYDANRNIISNGDSIAPHYIDSFYHQNISYGQVSIMLPFADSTIRVITALPGDHLWNLVATNNDTNSVYCDTLYSHTISYKAADGFGTLIHKKQVLLDTGIMGMTRLTACRHGNGNDWWVVKGGYHQNRLYTFRVTRPC